MAMRMSGLMSGMDTESIIQQLVEARSTKVNTTKKAQTKLEWKQDAWKSLNTKLKNLQQKYLSNMRFSSSYAKKVTKVSNSSIASVITGEDAVNGVQTLEVTKLAKTGYLTGAELKNADGEKGDYTALTKLSDLGYTGGSGTFSVKAGSKTVDVSVDENTTISDVLTKLKEAGLNANFDAKSQRFFVSAKTSGAANDFSITASDANGLTALSKLGLQASIGSGDRADAQTLAQYQRYAQYYTGDRGTTLAAMRSLTDAEVTSKRDAYLEQYKSLQASWNAADQKIRELENKYSGVTLDTAANYAAALEEKNARITEVEDALAGGVLIEEETRTYEERLVQLKQEASEISEKKADVETLASQRESRTALEGQIADVRRYIDVDDSARDGDGNVVYTATATNRLRTEVEDANYEKASFAAQVVANPSLVTSSGATKVSGQDAEIILNGATFTNNTNTFEINGLTITANAETREGESITLTTEQDTDGVYDMVKNFLKEYNAIINEMDKLYNAESAKGYEPLTSEEKEALSESEVADYEKKIKDALLRRDENVSLISQTMRSVMSGGVEVNGKRMYLFDFGIDTLGYFTAADNEKNAYHIDGDPDDGDTAGNADKLRGLIASDPDTVISFFTKLSQELYGKMSDLSKSVDGYRSYGSFYDDKKMKSDYEDYTSKIKNLEAKLNDYEDKWYKRFSKMETAMAKMQQNATAITGLLGGS